MNLKSTTLLAWLTLLAAAALFAIRGPLRAHSNYVNDFAAPYACAQLWLQHRNPYDPASFFPTWRASGAPSGPVYANPSSTRPVYPPPSILVLIPFALLRWPVASKALVLLSVVLYLTALLLFARFVPGTWRDPEKPCFVAYGLALAPIHSALHVSNLALLSASLLFLALYRLLRPLDTRELDLTTAALIALSLCIKPTLAPIVLIYLLWQRAWRTLGATVLIGTVLSVISLVPLLEQGTQWLDDLRRNINFVFTQGTANLSGANLTRFDRIDLQLPIYALTQSRTTAAILATLTAAVLLALWFLWQPAPSRVRDAGLQLDHNVLALSTLLLIGLLPTYQRFYSVMLILPLSMWAIRNFKHLFARLILAICAIFLFNTEVLLQQTALVPAGATHLPLLANAVLGPHLCWIILTLTIVLLIRAKYPPASHHQLQDTPARILDPCRYWLRPDRKR